MRTHFAGLVLTGALGLTLAAPAAAQTVYPPAVEQEAAVSATVVRPGEAFTFRVTGFGPATTVTGTATRRPLALGTSAGPMTLSSSSVEATASVTADDEGRAEFDLELDDEGVYALTARGVDASGAARVVRASVTVDGGPAAASADQRDQDQSSSLPYTGTSVATIVALATGFLVTGVGVQVLGRRRRQSA